MAPSAFRILHAGDFHLERCVGGLTEIPDSWESTLVQAPQRAAARVFELAVEHEVDAVLLAGDILDARLAGPPAVDFLRQQFRKLAKRNIRIYWVTGEAERRGPWPVKVALPENVSLIDGRQVRAIVHKRGEHAVGRILARGADEHGRVHVDEFSARRGELPQICLAYGRSTKADYRGYRGHYFALGGLHHAARVAGVPRRWEARYAGPPQSFGPVHAGPRGCVLVEFHDSGRMRSQLLPTDVVRWQQESVDADQVTSLDGLIELAHRRLDQLESRADGRHLLVRWKVRAPGVLGYQLRRHAAGTQFTTKLRDDKRWPHVWSVSVESELADSLAQRAEEDTILGEFLRAMAAYRQSPDKLPDPMGWFPSGTRAKQLADLIDVSSPAWRQRLVRDMEAWGYDLLQPAPDEAA